MEPISGRIVCTTSIILIDVRGMLLTRGSRSGLESWEGHFMLPRWQAIAQGEYRLELNDGRALDIVIRRTAFNPSTDVWVPFCVAGISK